MKMAEDYRKAYPQKTDDQIIYALGNEVRDKVETIHKYLQEMKEKDEEIALAKLRNSIQFLDSQEQLNRIQSLTTENAKLRGQLVLLTKEENREHMISIASEALKPNP